ncbi:dihydrolipoamide acetyltransferase family protein [Clostridium sp. Mt-5]|uniref:Dihydrolipoamide acetyltransferase component of pyruvate dehydrogenase complex n=1 Tax=Clostridium moutaii TaxID=3240932 RepID=A0ABV4BK46_9CLOT
MAAEIRMPQLGLTMTEGTIINWLKQVGDTVKKGEPLLEIETDKLTSEIESEADGVLLAACANEGDDVPVKGLLGVIGTKGEKINIDEILVKENKKENLDSIEEEKEQTTQQAGETIPAKRIKISPLAKKTARKMNVDYSEIIGSGISGRIIQRDILNNMEKVKSRVIDSEEKIIPKEVERREKLSGMRKVIAERMFKSHNEIPAVTQNVKVDVTDLMEFRKKINENREQKISINDFVLKAVAKALTANRHILVSLDGDEIVYHHHINLGMAVSVDNGLIVPVIKDADKMGIEALSLTAKDLAERARENKLNMDECSGSTFTISNLGMLHVETFTPIINQPDAAILGVCEIQDELALEEDKVVVRKKMRISMTYDHRLMDGATAARFKVAVKDLLENPMDVIL